MTSLSRRRLATTVLLAAGAAFLPTASATATTLPATTNATTAAMNSPIYRVENANGNTLLTPWKSEAENAVKNLGWSSYSVAFQASTRAVAGTQPVYRLYHPTTHTFLFTASPQEYAGATKHGYTQGGVAFHVPAWDMGGTQKVYRMHKVVDGTWRYRDALGAAQRDAFAGQGWILDGQTFRAVAPTGTPAPSPSPATTAPAPAPATPVLQSTAPAPAPAAAEHPGEGDGVFTFAQINDTQEDVFPDSRHRLTARVDWLLAHGEEEDVRFVGHTGDVVNWWETATDNENYRIADAELQPLVDSGIPFAVAVGNHDTKAVADGAGWGNTDAAGRPIARQGLRDTTLINQIFPTAEFTHMRGQMEPGKFDNSFHTFTAEGADFLVLSLELWPRPAAVEWAKKVVAEHPDHNVILLTHSFLTASGTVQNWGEYGDMTPAQINDQLVSRYPNVKMVLSGHVGTSTSRVLTSPTTGHRTLAVVTNLSPTSYGPLRLFDIDVKNDRVTSEIVRTTTNTPGGFAVAADIDWID